MNAHTPGPFEINGDGPLVALITSTGRIHAEITAPTRNRFEPLSTETLDANAHLLKAAPRLLEALKVLRMDANRLCDRQIGGTYEEDCRRALAQADEAISEAMGLS